jgi:hypothetical protein
VIRAVHRCPGRQVLTPHDAHTNARQQQPEADAGMPQHVEEALPLEKKRQKHADRTGDQHVQGDGDKRGGRPDRGNKVAQKRVA